MIFVVVKQFVRRLDEWSVAQANCKLYKKQQKDSIFLWRVWSWLRVNAGGVPNTCKSNDEALAC